MVEGVNLYTYIYMTTRRREKYINTDSYHPHITTYRKRLHIVICVVETEFVTTAVGLKIIN